MASMKEQVEALEKRVAELESGGGAGGITFQQRLLLELSKHINLNNATHYEANRIKQAADEIIKHWGVE
jgi:hypothetical protein